MDSVKNVRPDPSTFYMFPQILLIGNHRLELEHVPSEIAYDGHYKVRLHETQWRNRHAPQIPVSRKQLMVALQNVQGIYIRGTYNDMYRLDLIEIRVWKWRNYLFYVPWNMEIAVLYKTFKFFLF